MLVHRQDVGRIAVLTLNNPPANGYSYAMHRELDAHVCDLRMAPEIDVVVIRGSGDRFFCAGADIGYLSGLDESSKYAFCLHANETLLRIENTAKLFIAALNGHCVGGGLEIALACDLRIGKASGEKPNQVGLPEVSLGVLPGTGGTQRLTRVLGRARALQVMVEGANMSVEEAAEIGLVHRVFEAADWWGRVMAYAGSFCAPDKAAGAVGLIKRAVAAGADLPVESGLAVERELQQRLFASADAKEGLAAFLGKRKAVFSGKVGGAGSGAASPEAPPPDAPVKATPGSAVLSTAPAAPPAPAAPSASVPGSPLAVSPPASSPAASTGLAAPARPAAEVSTHVGDSGSIFDEEPTDAAPLPEPPGPEIDLMHIRIAEEVLNMLPTWLVRQFLVIPIRLEGELLVVALEEPANGKALTAVRDHTGREVRGVRADVESLVARYTMHYRA